MVDTLASARRVGLEAQPAEDPRDDELVWSLVRPIAIHAAGANIVMQMAHMRGGQSMWTADS